MDSSEKERNAYIDILKEAAKKHFGKPIGYYWAQAGDFFKTEEEYHMSMNYPALLAVNKEKKGYTVMRTAYTQTGV